MVYKLTKKADELESFTLDEGTKTIKKVRGAAGYEEIAEYSAEIKKEEIVTISDKGDDMAKKAATGDVILGVLAERPKPDVQAPYVEGLVELLGSIEYLPLKTANAAIKANDRIKLEATGADKGTATSPFVSLETIPASDPKEVIKVFLPLAGALS